jgi:hypothetical protein
MVTFLDERGRRDAMFIVFALVLAVVWLLGFAVYHVASMGFHLLLVVAAVSLVAHFVVRARHHRVT